MGLETAAIIAAVAAAAPALYAVGDKIFGSSGIDEVGAAGAKKMGDMQKAASAYGAYRPDMADARMKAMAQQLGAYQGAGNMMQAMYGGGGGAPGGTYTPGSGGWKPGDPGFDPKSPDPNKMGWPQVIGGMKFNSQAEYDAWFKANQDRNKATRDYENQMGVPKGTPVSPPIYVPPASGGIGAGSSGTSLVGPMQRSLMGDPSPLGPPMGMAGNGSGIPMESSTNPIAMALATPKR